MAQHDAAASADTNPGSPAADEWPFVPRTSPRSRTVSWATTGRIALAVFVGTLATAIVIGVAAWLYARHVANGVGDQLDKTFGTSTGSDGSSLTKDCKNAIDEDDPTVVAGACSFDDSGAVKAYETAIGYTG